MKEFGFLISKALECAEWWQSILSWEVHNEKFEVLAVSKLDGVMLFSGLLDDGGGGNRPDDVAEIQETCIRKSRIIELDECWKYSELKVKQERHWGHKVGIHEEECNVKENLQNYREWIATVALKQRDNLQERIFIILFSWICIAIYSRSIRVFQTSQHPRSHLFRVP